MLAALFSTTSSELFLIQPRASCPGETPLTVSCAFLHHSLIKKMSCVIPICQSDEGNHWSSSFPSESSLCQHDKKNPNNNNKNKKKTNKKPHRHAHRTVWWRWFSIWGSLPHVCQVYRAITLYINMLLFSFRIYITYESNLPEKNQFNTGSYSPKASRFYYFIIVSSVRV